jgi:hypothetical protein
MTALAFAMLGGCGAPEIVTGEGMTDGQVIETRQHALVTNLGYSVDCGSDRFPYPGECVLFDGNNFTEECRALRGSDSFWALSYNESAAKWRSGKSFNDTVGSYWCRPNDGLSMCVAYQQNANGSGNAHRFLVPIGNSSSVSESFIPTPPSSW